MNEIKVEIPKTDFEKRTFIHNYSKDLEVKLDINTPKETNEKIDEKKNVNENIHKTNKTNKIENISTENSDKHSQR